MVKKCNTPIAYMDQPSNFRIDIKNKKHHGYRINVNRSPIENTINKLIMNE